MLCSKLIVKNIEYFRSVLFWRLRGIAIINIFNIKSSSVRPPTVSNPIYRPHRPMWREASVSRWHPTRANGIGNPVRRRVFAKAAQQQSHHTATIKERLPMRMSAASVLSWFLHLACRISLPLLYCAVCFVVALSVKSIFQWHRFCWWV